MHKILMRTVLCWVFLWANSSYALDSYRFLHVTIDTEWDIFIFLLFAVLAPFFLMGVLVWRYTEHKVDSKKHVGNEPEGE